MWKKEGLAALPKKNILCTPTWRTAKKEAYVAGGTGNRTVVTVSTLITLYVLLGEGRPTPGWRGITCAFHNATSYH